MGPLTLCPGFHSALILTSPSKHKIQFDRRSVCGEIPANVPTLNASKAADHAVAYLFKLNHPSTQSLLRLKLLPNFDGVVDLTRSSRHAFIK